MNVKLIGVTQPVSEAMRELGAEALLAYCARVSSTANQDNHSTGSKLLRSLVKRQEWSPFEMVSLTMEIVTTRDISRQILRHRSFSFQEFSQRYAEVIETAIFREARMQHSTDRQSSTPATNAVLHDRWFRIQQRIWDAAKDAYENALSQGIAKEVARVLLPEGLTYTRLYMAGTLRSWIHYCALRRDNGTQLEHQAIAEDCWKVILEQIPSLKDVLV